MSTVCPNCSSDDVRRMGLQAEDSQLTRGFACRACHHSWQEVIPDTYTLEEMAAVDRAMHALSMACCEVVLAIPEPKARYSGDPVYDLAKKDYYRAIEHVRKAIDLLRSARGAMSVLATREEDGDAAA
jgi:hypothetical protein